MPGRMTPRRGWTLFGLAAVFAGFAVFVALTGGIDTRLWNIPIRSRSWDRPAAVALACGLLGASILRREILTAFSRLGPRALNAGRLLLRGIPLIAACSAGIAAIAFGTHAAGGADSYGYVSQAHLLARGRLTEPLLRSRSFTWPDVPHTLVPLGYRLSPSQRELSPTYPPGLPLLMAPFAAVDARAVFLVVPLCAVVSVWVCFLIGRSLGGPVVGTLSALLLSVSPTFLSQAMQPMSDVPVTAFWLGALVLGRHPPVWSAPAAGVLASVAVLIRPNLAPLALLVTAACATVTSGVRFDTRRALACAAGMLPGLLALGAIQDVRYGSPLSSGYGAVGDLFGLQNIGPNLARYPRWLTETHTPFIWLWLAAPLAIARASGAVRTFAWISYAFSIAVFLAYFPYTYFRLEESFYTRFLLPGIPVFLIFATLVTVTVSQQVAPRIGKASAVLLVVVIVLIQARRSVTAGTFELHQHERKYPAVGAFVRERLPPAAFVLAMQHSGSLRHYSSRHTLRWDLLDRASLGRALTSLRDAGYTPFAVLDEDEDVAFRNRFDVLSAEALEQMFVVEKIGATFVYGFR